MAYESAEADIMKRPPRNAETDRLVTDKLIYFAYGQIGIMQAMAGFYCWMVVLNDYGFPPHILLGLGRANMWQKQPLFCRFSGGHYVNDDGAIDTMRDPRYDPPTRTHPLWFRGDNGRIIDCEFPLKNYAGKAGSAGDFKFDDSSTYEGGTEREQLITVEAMDALMSSNYHHYVPWRGRTSPFWNRNWLAYDTSEKESISGNLGEGTDSLLYFSQQSAGLWSICAADPALEKATGTGAYASSEAIAAAKDYKPKDGGQCTSPQTMGDKEYEKAIFCNGKDTSTTCTPFNDHVMQVWYCDDECSANCATPSDLTLSKVKQCQNIASKMVQKEALHHAQATYFITIVVVQWADLIICKTRWLSVRTQGMQNTVLNFGLFFETLLAAWLMYAPGLNLGLGTRPVRFTHWFPGIPFSILIFVYDECRKYLMRHTSKEHTMKGTGQVYRDAGWIEQNTYY
jgi:sodium/potassium-transporting ATPase subunit alpha